MIEQYITPGWITLAISLIGFISFYLGKIVLDFYPSSEDTPLHYIVGFILFLIYILIPSLIFYYWHSFLIIQLNLWGFIIFIMVYSFLAEYFKIKMNIFLVNRGMAKKYFFREFYDNLKQFKFNLNKMPWVKGFFNELPSQIKVIILGYVVIFLIVNIILYFNNWVIRILISMIALFTLNNIIICHNAKGIKYDKIILEDSSNRLFNGTLIKKDSNYIFLNTEKKLYIFPRENVKSIQKMNKVDLKETKKQIGKVAIWWNKFCKKHKLKMGVK